MLPELKGKGLFVFSDPGGTKSVLAYIKLNKVKDYMIITDRNYDFFSDYNLNIQFYNEKDETGIFNTYKPDYVFTGTSYTSKIELKFIQAAKQKHIPTYAFIDHYTSFLERFELNNEYVYPDNICVTDAKAEKIAKENGLESGIIITGNFYHSFLSDWAPDIQKPDFLKQINVPLGNKLLVFAPDPLTNVGGKGKYGLDEISVWENLTEALTSLPNRNYTIVIKLHPNQQKEKILPKIAEYRDSNIIFGDSLHTNTLLYHSDIIIGMFSNILVESAVMRKQIIRCLKGLIIEDPFGDTNVGNVVFSVEALHEKLVEILNK